jgi:GT2 family glycosyltransferase
MSGVRHGPSAHPAGPGQAATGRPSFAPRPLPVVDIIIPCFNQSRFLGQAIETALAQTYPRVTVTVVDDGSTDGSAAVARSYGDRIRYLGTAHRGLSAARNTGLRATSGDYVLFLDSDDYLDPAAASRHMEAAATQPSAAVFHSGWQYTDEIGGSVVEAGPYALAEDPFHAILSGYCPPGSSFVVKRDALVAAGPFDEGLRLQEDRDMWLRVAAAGHAFVTVPGTLASYRRHPSSMSATASAASILDATLAVIRRSQTYHRDCPTCAPLVADSLHNWRMAHLHRLKHELVAVHGPVQLARALAGLVVTTVREPSLTPTVARAFGRRLAIELRARTPVHDLVLFFHAFRLARLAQGVRGQASLPTLTATLASLPALPRRVEPDAAHRATVRACIRGARWLGFRDTCLVRSLVTASLLSDCAAVQLHVGFASPAAGERLLEGHAWVSVDGEVVGGAATAMTVEGSITELVIPLRRDGDEPGRVCDGG